MSKQRTRVYRVFQYLAAAIALLPVSATCSTEDFIPYEMEKMVGLEPAIESIKNIDHAIVKNLAISAAVFKWHVDNRIDTRTDVTTVFKYVRSGLDVRGIYLPEDQLKLFEDCIFFMYAGLFYCEPSHLYAPVYEAITLEPSVVHGITEIFCGEILCMLHLSRAKYEGMQLIESGLARIRVHLPTDAVKP